MDNLIQETNTKLKNIIEDLSALKNEYEDKVNVISQSIDKELAAVKKYKEDFFTAKEKIEKANDDIKDFEKDYQSLVEKFNGESLAGILLSANKEINSKIEENKMKIAQDRKDINALIAKAEVAKAKLVKLTAEKKILKIRLNKITEAYNYYVNSINEIIENSKKGKIKKEEGEVQETNTKKSISTESKNKKRKAAKKSKEIKIHAKSDELEEVKNDNVAYDENPTMNFDFNSIDSLVNIDDLSEK